MQLLKMDRKAFVSLQALIIGVLIVGCTATAIYVAGGFISAIGDPDKIFNPDWGLGQEIPDIDYDLPHWKTVNIRFTGYDYYNEKAPIAAGVTVVVEDVGGTRETLTTDSNGQVTTVSGRYNCFDPVTAYVGGQNNNTGYGQQRFSWTINSQQGVDEPSVIDQDYEILYKRLAIAGDITQSILSGASTITSYNVTTSGTTLSATIMWTQATAERGVLDCYDYLEDGGETEEFWLFLRLRGQNNTAPGSVTISLSGSQRAMFGTSTLLIGKRMSEFCYDLDDEGVPMTGKGPSHSVAIEIDWSNAGISASNQTEFYLDVWLCVGTPWSHLTDTAQYESYTGGEVLIKATTSFAILS